MIRLFHRVRPTMGVCGAAGGMPAAALTLAVAGRSSIRRRPSLRSTVMCRWPRRPPARPVNSASPSYARRDTTLNVRVLGSGFTSGAVAEWSVDGVPNAAKVKTNSTQFVSSSELVANITM